MATQSARFAERIETNAWSLEEQAKVLRHLQPDPGLTIIDIKLESGKAATLLELCKQVEDVRKRKQIEFAIQRVQKKFAQAEQINQFLQKDDANAVHPRVEQLIDRLTRMKQKPLPSELPLVNQIFDKLFKTRMQLDQIEGELRNPASVEALKKARSMVGERDIDLLQNYQNFVHFSGDTGSVLEEKYSHYYAEHTVPKDSQKKASAYYAMCYLECVTKYADLRIKNFERVLHWPPEEMHRKMAHFLEEQGSGFSSASLERLIEKFFKDKLTPVPFIPEICGKNPEYAVDASTEEIQKKLQTLVELKNAHQLSSMGAFIQIGPQTLAIVFHSTGRISLYDACGNIHEGKRKSIESNLGNTKDAANLLHVLTAKIGPKEPISLQPYCDEFSFKTKSWITNNITASFVCSLHPGLMVGGTEPVPGPQSIGNYFSMPGIFGVPMMPGGNFPSSFGMMPGPINFEMPAEMGLESSPPEVDSLEDADQSQEADDSVEEQTASTHTVFELQRIIHLLSARSHDAYCQSLAYVHRLESVTWPTGGTALDRVYFHLFKIQDKETPDKIDRTEANWGKIAFETEAFSTPDQKLRALQRTQVELLLDLIRAQIQGACDGDRLALLNALEGLQLQASDLPQGQNNAALALFEKGLKTLNEARRKDSLENYPGDEQLLTLFSRNYFLNDGDGSRIQALAELASDFKAAWGI